MKLQLTLFVCMSRSMGDIKMRKTPIGILRLTPRNPQGVSGYKTPNRDEKTLKRDQGQRSASIK